MCSSPDNNRPQQLLTMQYCLTNLNLSDERSRILLMSEVESLNLRTMANYTLHKSNTRGSADHGWLKTFHTFSFAEYMDPQKVHFGALRVLNDDRVEGGRGFG